MRMNNFRGYALTAAIALSSASSLYAAPVTFNDRTSFLSSLTAGSIKQEGFEAPNIAGATALPGHSLDLSALVPGATLTGSSKSFFDSDGNLDYTLTGRVVSNSSCQIANKGIPACQGRYNTTDQGKQFWESSLGFDIFFGSAIEAFGFNLTDYGDFKSAMTVDLLDSRKFKIGSIQVGKGTDLGNGSLQFFGLTDTSNSVYGLHFSVGQQNPNNGLSYDWLGFDDLVTGKLITDTNVPEPGSLALVGISLAGLALTRRRRR
nr:PEP-CTERM sorting domain-containing protein [uncultured Roseateles sp.]